MKSLYIRIAHAVLFVIIHVTNVNSQESNSIIQANTQKSTVTVTFNVDMSEPISNGTFVEGTDKLWISGSFFAWPEPGSNPGLELIESSTNDVYTLDIVLNSGTYEYKYFKNSGWANGEWDGQPNRYVLVDSLNTVVNDLWSVIHGLNCESAATAVEDSNAVPATLNFNYWYTFIMPETGKLTITSESNEYVSVGTGGCSNLNMISGDYGDLSISSLQAGEVVYIIWETTAGGNFTWNLSVSPLKTGDNCEIADTALAGSNHVPVTEGLEYWYKYKMPEEGKLVITSESDENVHVFKGNCHGYIYQGGGYNSASITSLASGDSVLIIWQITQGGDFDWNLAVASFEAGDNCEYADTAQEGINNIPYTEGSEYWYVFEMPMDGKLQLVSEDDKYVSIYSGECENIQFETGGSGSVSVNTLSLGDKVFFKWDTYSGSVYDWTLTVSPFEAGDNCEYADTAEDGNNVIPSTDLLEYWYSYTMPLDGKLQLTSTNGQSIAVLKGTCELWEIKGGGWQSLILTNLFAGDEIFIVWETTAGGGFEWNLSVTPFKTGDNCEFADTAVDGENTLPATNLENYWYKYTMPGDDKFIINSAIDNSVSVYKGSCDQLIHMGSGWQNLILTNLAAGDELFITWNGGNAVDASWNLAVVPFEAGELCELAVAAKDGSNFVPATSLERFWFKYTMPSESKLVINSTSGGYVEIQTGNCDNPNYLGGNYQNMTVTDLSEGDEVFIIWNTYSGGNYAWDLSVVPYGPGDNCDYAVEAVEGGNTVPAGATDEYWYKFTMPEEGKLKLRTLADASVVLMKGNCENKFWLEEGYMMLTYADLHPGEEVYIIWRTYGEGCSWNLELVPFEPGDNCYNAKEAVEGVNPAYFTEMDYFWYSFTMPEDGKLEVIADYIDYTIYSGTCYSLNHEKYGWGRTTINTLSAGDIVYFRFWTYYGGMPEWSLSVTPFEAGDNCDNAVLAETGINTVPQTSSSEYWYSFIMPEEGRLSISSVSDNYVEVYTGMCNDLSMQEDDYQELSLTEKVEGHNLGILSFSNLSDGDTLFIKWELYSQASFDWELNVQPLVDGDNCSMAITAVEGVNTVEGITSVGDIWYSYTMVEEGKIVVTSSSYNYVTAYKGSCSQMHFRMSGENYLEVTNLSIGDVVYFQWENFYPEFEWELEVVPIGTAEDCRTAVAALEGTNTLPMVQQELYYYKFTMPSTPANLNITSESYAEAIILKNGCEWSEIVAYGLGSVQASMLAPGDEVYIVWYSGYSESFDWNLSLTSIGEGDNCEMAVPAQYGSNIAPYSNYWFSYEVTETAIYDISVFGADDYYTYVRVYPDCEGTLVNEDFFSSSARLHLTSGETLYILCGDLIGGQNINLIIAKEGEMLLPQSIAFEPIDDKTFGDPDFEINATASSGLEVFCSVVEGPAVVSGTTVSLTDDGTVAIEAVQPGNHMYLAAHPFRRSFEVMAASDLKETIAEGLRLYPNPVRDVLVLELENISIERIQLFESSGRFIREYKNDSRNLDLGQISAGIYYIKISTPGNIYISKIIKE